MYKLIKQDGVNPEAISDRNYSQIGGASILYAYAGPDPEGPSEDEKNAQVEAANAEEVVDLQNNEGVVKETPLDHDIDHVVTEQTLNDNPDLKDQGVNVGDTITLSKDESEEANKETEYVLTQEDFDKDPNLSNQGLKVGDKIKLDQHE